MWRDFIVFTPEESSDRRRYQRFELSVCVWLRFHNDPSVHATTTVDVSPEGARFTANHRARPEEHVLLYMQLEPVAYTVECKGKICWAEAQPTGGTAFGVRFLDLGDEEHDNIVRTIEHEWNRGAVSPS